MFAAASTALSTQLTCHDIDDKSLKSELRRVLSSVRVNGLAPRVSCAGLGGGTTAAASSSLRASSVSGGAWCSLRATEAPSSAPISSSSRSPMFFAGGGFYSNVIMPGGVPWKRDLTCRLSTFLARISIPGLSML